MPLIEELPTTATHRVTHGWAYVPDTGPTAIAAVQPGNRKRGAGGQRDGTATATAKQQKATQLRLANLDKENYKDGVTVPIPPRADKKTRKMTTNVRRILTSQRAFAHYLADEEANTTSNSSTTHAQSSAQAVTASRADGRRKSTHTNLTEQSAPTTTTENTNNTTTTAPTPSGRGRRRKTLTTTDKDKGKDTAQPASTPVKSEDVTMTDAPTPTPTTTTTTTTTTTITAPTSTTISATTSTSTITLPRPPPYDPKLDAHPLLRTTDLPKMPSARVMQALLAEPPLSYTAARATYLSDGGAGNSGAGATSPPPVRRFCGVCGYWGRVKCRKCGEWTCGLMECWKGHEGVCVAVGVY